MTERAGAQVARFRDLLAQSGEGNAKMQASEVTRAVTAAKEYLVKYPNGFARSDAQAIMAQKP